MSRISTHIYVRGKSIYCNVNAWDEGTEKHVLFRKASGAGSNSSGPNDSAGCKVPVAKLRRISEQRTLKKKERLTVQAFPNTSSAYWGSLKSYGQSGKLSSWERACFQIEIEDRFMRIARRSFVVWARCNRSRGFRWPNIWGYCKH